MDNLDCRHFNLYIQMVIDGQIVSKVSYPAKAQIDTLKQTDRRSKNLKIERYLQKDKKCTLGFKYQIDCEIDKMLDRQRYIQIDRYIDRQIDRQNDSYKFEIFNLGSTIPQCTRIKRQIYRQIDRDTDRYIDRQIEIQIDIQIDRTTVTIPQCTAIKTVSLEQSKKQTFLNRVENLPPSQNMIELKRDR